MAEKRAQAVSNEEIVAAIMQHGTIEEAAKAAGISRKTIYARMYKDRDFQAIYTAAKIEVLRNALHVVNGGLSEAFETALKIMRDKETNPAVRLQAAQVVISSAAKFSNRLAMEECNAKNGGGFSKWGEE